MDIIVDIRNMEITDLNEASDVFVKAFNSVGEMWNHETALLHLEELYKPAFFIGAYLDGKLAGFAATKVDYLTDHKELCIDILAVLPEFHGKHIGGEILKNVEALAKSIGIHTIWLQTSTKLPSYNFYKKNGFIDTHWIAVYKTLS